MSRERQPPSPSMPSDERRLLLVSGSLRRGSVNTAVLESVRRTVPPSVDACFYEELASLPHFNPDLDPVDPAAAPPEVVAMRAAVSASDAVLICTPEYAGAVPGALKNLLEWTIGSASLVDKPVAWINPSTSPGRAQRAHEALRATLEYTGCRLVHGACLDLPVPRTSVREGTVDDPALDHRFQAAAAVLLAASGSGAS